jgi:hypothetical protein
MRLKCAIVLIPAKGDLRHAFALGPRFRGDDGSNSDSNPSQSAIARERALMSVSRKGRKRRQREQIRQPFF